MNVRGKTVLVTGAAGGLGQALCRQLSKEGANILALDIDQDALAGLAPGSATVETLCCDLTDEAACRAVLSNRSIDIVINNAGITHFSRFLETEPATLQKVMAVNFFGAVNVTKTVLPSIVQAKGMIVAISSVAGFSPLYGRTGYSASKHAMHGFFSSLRAELKEEGVQVMIVCPSFIATQTKVRKGGEDTSTARPGSASETAGKSLSPEEAATKICKAMRADRQLLVLGTLGKLAYWLNKLSPKVFERQMIKKIKPEFSRK